MTLKLPTPIELRKLQHQGDHDAVLAALEDKNLTHHLHVRLLKGISLALKAEPKAAQAFLLSDLIPSNSAEYSDLAMAKFLSGQIRQAHGLLEQAVAESDADAVAFGRLAAVCLSLGELEKAREYYQEAVNREPGRAEWHSNLAGILARQQKLDEALENYDVALNINPDLQQTINARQHILIALQRTEEVIEELEKMVEHDPGKATLKLRLARALRQGSRPTEAIKLLRHALMPIEEIEKPDPLSGPGEEKSEAQTQWEDQLCYRVLLVDTLIERTMIGMALVFLNQILELKPENPIPFICRKINALIEMGSFEKAEALLDEADDAHPDVNPLKTCRANLYCESGRYIEAETLQRNLLETYPGDAGLKSQLAQTLLWTGKLDEAADLLEEAAQINPMALAQMVNAKRLPENDAALKKMAAVADNPFLDNQARITMGYALAEVYDKRKDIDNAWKYLDLANRLTEKTLNYSADGFSRKVDAIIEVYSKNFFETRQSIRNSDRTPIFVVGMPRSGTTLTEQILCSHPDIFGAGELDLISRLTRLIPKVLKKKVPYPGCMTNMTPHLREEAARFYLHGLYQYDREHPYVVDKMPHNFEKLGLIALIFPKARIIHVRRDPRDTALSNLQQNFKAKHGGIGYAFDQEKTARQINDYHRMMAHWREVLPIPMFEFFYEDLVSDQDYWSRKLLEFVGVEWDDRVHDFYKTERAVRTASVSQVRQPIYQTSRQKWRRYEIYLAPLLQALNSETTALWEQRATRS